MPRFPNFPTTCAETQRLELAYLRKIGLLQPGTHSRTLYWSSRGERTGSIGIEAHITGEQPYLRLYYTLNGTKKYDYRVQLEAVVSNLAGVAGHRYYLVCPHSGRRATILYLRTGTGIFAHREAFATQERLYYDSQLEAKRLRGLAKYFAADHEWEREYRKGRKTSYQGKPTRWYARLLAIEERAATVAPAVHALLRL